MLWRYIYIYICIPRPNFCSAEKEACLGIETGSKLKLWTKTVFSSKVYPPRLAMILDQPRFRYMGLSTAGVVSELEERYLERPGQR